MLIKEYARMKARLLRPSGLEPAHNAHPHENGEYRFLQFIGVLPAITQYDAVIDVGANSGEWTAEAIGHFSGRGISAFYCVEPIPTFANDIRRCFVARCSGSDSAGGAE